METGNSFVKEKLIGSLYSEESMEEDAENAIEELRAMGCPINAPYYVVIDSAFEPTARGQEVAADLAMLSGGSVHASASRTGTRLLVLGNTPEDAEERVYGTATSLSQELERAGCTKIRTGIGEIVEKPGEIVKSFKTARHIRHLLVEKEDEKALILGTREMGEPAGDKKTSAVINEAKLYMAGEQI